MYILELSYGCPSKKYSRNGIFQFEQAKAISKYCDVVFGSIDLRSIKKWRSWGIKKFIKNDLPIFEINLPLGKLPYCIFQKLAKKSFSLLLNKIIKEKGKPSVIHIHFGEVATWACFECVKQKIPYFITEHSSVVHTMSLTKKELHEYSIAYAQSKFVISVSKSLSIAINKLFGVNPIVIPNIVNLSEFRYVERIKNPKTKPYFSFVSAGNLVFSKGFDLLINAFAKINNFDVDCRLIIMGDGPLKKELIKLISKLELKDKVTMFGKFSHDEFFRVLSHADCFVLASRHETFGLVYAEAMSTGLPVVGTKCGGPEDFVDSNKGILADTNDVDGLSLAMQNIIENYDFYDGKKISNDVKYAFSEETVAKKIIDVLIEKGIYEKSTHK